MNALLGQKLLANLVTISVFLFSSFKGNDASFSAMHVQNSGNYLILQTHLENSFENDFQEIFQSGKQVDVWFNLEVKQNRNLLQKQEFRHSVQYDPLSAAYKVYLQEQKTTRVVRDYADMVQLISDVEYTLPPKPGWSKIDIHLDSFLKKMPMESTNKEIDLMMLWKLKKPVCKISLDLKAYES
ncbi:MAG TPA: DUF4390 domain-containing protein [Candidatus Cloacimonadota bacterium]|nr:DUF4390 domain-containing protein [Candidatus Cloacimonadota bacterium]HPT71011.1 DUF4390 domain-containing protein [Candidatus Cloacimonadota bacterium]